MNMRFILVTTFLALTLCAHAVNVFDMPAIFPRHVVLQQRLAQSVRSGNIPLMEETSREGIELMPDDATWQYNLACALAYRADPSAALDALDRAITLGFRDANAIAADNDLKRIANAPRFALLLDKARKLQGKPVEGVITTAYTSAFMGFPIVLTQTNTVWNFDLGVLQPLIRLQTADTAAKTASAYNGPDANRMRAWLTAGTAAGNAGDLYMNRDRNHSLIDVKKFPLLTPVVYGNEAKARGLDANLPNALFGMPLIGNASLAITAGPFWRSLPRASSTDPKDSLASANRYMDGQIWVYPSHLDFTPEKGDLFPANMPYTITSLGSSYTDQPFVEALLATSAAFQPETKRELISSHRYAATLQMLLRATQRTVRTPADYFTNKAHPIVFSATNLNVTAMLTRAHAMAVKDIPPIVRLNIRFNDAAPQPGVDFFDVRMEPTCITPSASAVVLRDVRRRERTFIATANAIGTTTGPFEWHVLQAPPGAVTITPKGNNNAMAEITVRWFEPFSIPSPVDGKLITTHRIDIACFAPNATNFSAPSIISFYRPPNEIRTYSTDGRILVVDYTNPYHAYTDPMLTIEKDWKDTYLYTPNGVCVGWTRLSRNGTQERFTNSGRRVLSFDKLRRPLTTVAVRYMLRESGLADSPSTLTYTDETSDVKTTIYANAGDLVGTEK